MNRREVIFGALAATVATQIPAADLLSAGGASQMADVEALRRRIEAALLQAFDRYIGEPITAETLQLMVADGLESARCEFRIPEPQVLQVVSVRGTPEDIRAGRISIDVISNESRTTS